ncbi:OprD family outer membrane porin [Xanthomonas medicagonis]|uniref:OprD family outer membrane porin n=1 Tax=Xanthomonas medicagonis TaxID=3160841 RepID=UPI003516B55D
MARTEEWSLGRFKATVEQGELRDLYRQQVVALAASQPIAGATLDAEVRYYVSADIGGGLAGPVDNRAWNMMLAWKRNGQQIAVAYQGLSGRTAMPWVGGTDGNVMNWTFINDFMERDERSWQLRYQLDGKAIRVPGLKVLVRYVRGDHARPSFYSGEGRQWQRDVEFEYTFQRQALKGFSVRWRNGFFRSNYQRDAEENRLMLIYTARL